MPSNNDTKSNSKRASDEKIYIIESLKKNLGSESDEVADALSYILEEINKAEELKICKICQDRERDVTINPCGHFVSCIKCTRSIKQCPICRATITSFTKTHLS